MQDLSVPLCCFGQSSLCIVIPAKALGLEVAVIQMSPTSHFPCSLASFLPIYSSMLYSLSPIVCAKCVRLTDSPRTQLRVTVSQTGVTFSLVPCNFSLQSHLSLWLYLCSTDLNKFNSVCRFPIAYRICTLPDLTTCGWGTLALFLHWSALSYELWDGVG